MNFCRKVEIVAIDTDKNIFLNFHTYKTDIGQHFHKSEKIRQGGATVTKQLTYFSNADNYRHPQGPQGQGALQEEIWQKDNY